jgi:hypothetical protein
MGDGFLILSCFFRFFYLKQLLATVTTKKGQSVNIGRARLPRDLIASSADKVFRLWAATLSRKTSRAVVTDVPPVKRLPHPRTTARRAVRPNIACGSKSALTLAIPFGPSGASPHQVRWSSQRSVVTSRARHTASSRLPGLRRSTNSGRNRNFYPLRDNANARSCPAG